MAATKLSDLPALTGSGSATGDLVYVDDVSAGTSGSKSMTLAELWKSCPGALDVGAAGTLTIGATNATGVSIAQDLTLSGGKDLIFVGTTGQCQVLMTDNLASALKIAEGSTAYLTFCTTNSAEKIQVNQTLDFPGSTGANLLTIPDNLANAFDINESGNTYIRCTTTNSAETVLITPLLTCVAGISFTGGSGANLLKLTDNLASALDITEASNSYIKCVTTNSGEKVLVTPMLTCSAGITLATAASIDFTGATGANLLKMVDNLASSLDIMEAANSYLKFTTTNSAEVVTIGQRLSVAAALSTPVTAVQDLTVASTITLPSGGYAKRLSASGGVATAVILTAGSVAGQEITLFNIETVNTITFATAATSNVADGALAVIGALRAIKFIWDATSSRWYRTG